MRERARNLGLAVVAAMALVGVVASAQDLPPLPPANDGGVKIEYVPGGDAVDAGAPPPPAPAPAPAGVTAGDEERARKYETSFKLADGYQYAQLAGVPFMGTRLRGGIGVQRATNGQYVTLAAFIGETHDGLRTWDLRVGWTGDLWRSGILRLGADVELGYLTIRRATENARMWALGGTAGGHVGVDVYHWGPRGFDRGVYVEGRFDVLAEFGLTFAWSPSVLGGFRY